MENLNAEDLQKEALKDFLAENTTKPSIWVAISPQTLKNRRIHPEKIKDLLSDPPGNRKQGFTMNFPCFELEEIEGGYKKGLLPFRQFRIIKNGLMELRGEINVDHSGAKKILDICAVTEFPTSFLRLYRAIVDSEKIDNDFFFSLVLKNIIDYILIPAEVNTAGYDLFYYKAEPLKNDGFSILMFPVENKFDPEEISFRVMKKIYERFKINSTIKIRFFNEQKKKFEFPQ